MRKKLTQTSKLLFLFIGLIFCISFSSEIKAQNCIILNDGFCHPPNELSLVGQLNGKNQYATANNVIKLSWNSDEARWEITRTFPNNFIAIEYIMTADSYPNPLDNVAASSNNTPWTDMNNCGGGLVVSGACTQSVIMDTDGDGLSDDDEVNIHGTDPTNPDTDDDFLSDGDEINIHNTDPLNDDTDGDGLVDGSEINNSGTDPLNPDTDGDALTDHQEVIIYNTDPLNPDTDGDGLIDSGEIDFYSTDPLDPDTDGGGVEDGIEVNQDSTDPNDPTDDMVFCDDAAEGPSISCPLPQGLENVSIRWVDETAENNYELAIRDADMNVVFGGETFGSEVGVASSLFECGKSYTIEINQLNNIPLTNLKVITSNGVVIDESQVSSGSIFSFNLSPCVTPNWSIPNDVGQCSAVPNLYVSSSDNCTFNPPITYSLSGATTGSGTGSGSDIAFNVGTTAISYTATDDAGNTSSCDVNIIVTDITPPIASCPANITQNNELGQCGAIVDFSIPDPTDNCSATATASPASGSFFDVGSTTVTVTATDASGNIATCNFNVVVNDAEAPTLTCPTTQTVNNDPSDCGAIVDFTLPDLVDNCLAQGGLSDNDMSMRGPGASVTSDPAPGSFFDVGTTVVTITASDEIGNISTCTFDVVVNDTEAPNLSCPADVSLSCDDNTGLSNIDLATATDNCSNSPSIFYSDVTTPGACPQKSTIVRTYWAVDANGNSSSCEQTINIIDDTPPVLVCPPNASIPCDANTDPFNTGMPIATDNCDGAPTFTFADVATYGPGQTITSITRTWTAFDACGNSSFCEQTITLTDTEAPIALCANTTVNLNSGDAPTVVNPSIFDGGSAAVCGDLSFSADILSFDCSDLGNMIDVTLTVTSISNGLTANCTATITVADPNSVCCDAPIAVCNDFTIALDENGLGSISVADVAGGSMADCGLASESLSETDFDCTKIGETTVVTYTITDVNGDSDNCTSTITVSGLPCGWVNGNGVGCDGDNEASYDSDTETYTLTSDGCSSAHPYTADSQGGIYQELCGDGYIKAFVTNVNGNGFAGVELRNSLDPGAKKIGIGTNTVNKIVRVARILDNYPAWPQEMFSLDKFWVKIERNGPYFKALASADDITYIPFLFQAIQMDDCTQVGLFVYSKVPGEVVTADITNVEVGQSSSSLESPSDEIEISTIAPTKLHVGLSPNPAKDVVRIDLNSLIGQNVNISIYNINGQLMTNRQIDYVENATEVIALDHLPAGTYYVNIQTAQQQQTLKLIKQ